MEKWHRSMTIVIMLIISITYNIGICYLSERGKIELLSPTAELTFLSRLSVVTWSPLARSSFVIF